MMSYCASSLNTFSMILQVLFQIHYTHDNVPRTYMREDSHSPWGWFIPLISLVYGGVPRGYIMHRYLIYPVSTAMCVLVCNIQSSTTLTYKCSLMKSSPQCEKFHNWQMWLNVMSTIFQSCQDGTTTSWVLIEPRHEKNRFLPLQKQRRRSVLQ